MTKYYVLFLGLCLWLGVSVLASPVVTFEGTFSDSTAGLLQGRKTITMRLNTNVDLSNNSMGNELWKEVIPAVLFTDGFMSVDLGQVTPLTKSLFIQDNVSFLLELDGVGKVSVPLRSVPYAVSSLVAQEALKVSANNVIGVFSGSNLIGSYVGITGIGTLISTLNVNSDLVVNTRSLVVNKGLNRVGIGTTSPQSLLDVAGNVRLSSGILIFPDGTTMNTAVKSSTILGGFSQPGSIAIEADSDKNQAGDLRLRTSGSDRIIIANNGWVGIGNREPAQELDVNGGIRILNTSISNPGSMRFNGTNFEGFNGTAWKILDAQPNSGGGWDFQDRPKIISLVDANSRVGIGTTLPSTTLEIVGTVSSNIFAGTFRGNGSGITQVLTDAISGVLPLAKGGTGMSTFSASSLVYADVTQGKLLAMPVLRKGQLLIGDGVGTPSVGVLAQGVGITVNTTTTGSILISHGQTSTQSTVTLNNGIVFQGVYLDSFGHTTRLSTGNLDLRYYTRGQAESTFMNVTGDVMTGPLTFRGTSISMRTVSQNESITLMPVGSGKVGIGLTNPQQKLDILGGIRLGNTTANVRGSMRFNSDTNRFEGFNGSDWVFLDLQTTEGVGWVSAHNVVSLLLSASSVGIGTSQPLEKLHVGGNLFATGNIRTSGNIYLNRNTIANNGFTGNWDFNDGILSNAHSLSVGNFSITQNTLQNTASTINILSGSNKGVAFDAMRLRGTDLSGISNTDITLTPVSGKGILLNGPVSSVTSLSMGGVLSGVTTANFSAGFSADSPTFVVKAATHSLGIGTTLPSANLKMHVVGDVAIGAGSVRNNTSQSDLFVQGDAILGGRLWSYGAGTRLQDLTVSGNSRLSVLTGNVGVGTANPTAKLEVRSSTASPIFKAVNTSRQTAFIVLDSNKVGINTTAPSTTLQVVGTINATTYLGDGSKLNGINILWLLNGSSAYYSSLVGIGLSTPQSLLHLAASTPTRASLIINPGTLATTPVAGAIEYDGSSLYYTTQSGSVRKTLATLDSVQTLTNKNIRSNGIGSNTVSGNWTTNGNLTLSGSNDLTLTASGGHTVVVSSAAWGIDASGYGTFSKVLTDTLAGSTTTLNITPFTNTGILLDSHFGFKGNVLSGKTNANTILRSFTGKAIQVEGVLFSTSNISNVRNLTLTGNLSVSPNIFYVSKTNQNVGIGTSAPSTSGKLNIVGGDLIIGSGTVHDGTASEDLYLLGSGNLVTEGNAYLGLSSGLVGIGTTLPVAKLGIKTSGSTPGLTISTTGETPLFLVKANGTTGVGTANPTAVLHIKAGSTSLAPLKIDSGTPLSSPESGAIELDGTNLFYTTSDLLRRTVVNLNATQSLTNKTLLSSTLLSNNVSGNWATTGPLGIGNSSQIISINATTWKLTPTGNGRFTRVTVGNSQLDSNTLSSTSGLLNLNSASGQPVKVNGFVNFQNGIISESSGSTLTINASSGKSVVIEKLGFKNHTLSTPSGTSLNITVSGASAFSVNSNKLYLDATTGFIGIGRTSPRVSLDINGTITANLYVGDGSGLYNLSDIWTSTTNQKIWYTYNNVGIGATDPRALLELGSGTTSIAPLIIRSGSLLTSPVAGAVEFDGSLLYYADSGPTRKTLVNLDSTQTLTHKTLSSGTLGSNAISGTLTTSGALSLTGSNTIDITATNWSVNTSGESTFSKVYSNTFLNSSGAITLTPFNNVFNVGSTFSFDTSARSLTLAGGNASIVASGGQLQVESVVINGAAVSGVSSLGMNGNLTVSNGSSIPKALIDNSGNVSVNGTLRVDGGTFNSAANMLFQPSSGKNFTVTLAGSGATTFTTATFALNTNKLFLTSAGKVGIGTTLPSTELGVIGTVSANFFVGNGSQLTGIDSKWKDDGSLGTDHIYFTKGRVGIGLTNPYTALHVSTQNGVLFVGNYGSGAIPMDSASVDPFGTSTRFMWYPKKAALRAGQLETGAGNLSKWNDSNIGTHSVSFGHNTSATGNFSGSLGGDNNVAGDDYAAISGGQNNTVNGPYGFIGGGLQNIALKSSSVVGGGYSNTASGQQSIVGGGQSNTASGTLSVVVGGSNNSASGSNATIVGGGTNAANGNTSFLGGGSGNKANATSAYVGGGQSNSVTGNYSSLVGGQNNRVGSVESSIVGGNSNKIYGSNQAFLGGGLSNQILSSSGYSSLLGGNTNTISSSTYASIAGGQNNTISSAPWGFVAGGNSNSVLGSYGFAAGRRAIANDQGSFVWGDSQNLDISSTSTDQFIVRAQGGIYLGKSSVPVIDASHIIDTSVGTYLDNTGNWANASDRNKKENFITLNAQEVLDKVVSLPITKWNYKIDPNKHLHIGPMAQDFYSAFNLGDSDKVIYSIDEAGVAFVAIQKLYRLIQEKETRISSLEKRLEALEKLVSVPTSNSH